MKTLIGITALLICYVLPAQKYYTKTGHIDFYSHAPLEDITAKNNQVVAFIDTESGSVSFAVLIKSFEFEKALMQQHFNENYMESDIYPKSTFEGQIKNYSADKINSGEKYEAEVSGKLTIHGVTKEIETKAYIQLKDDTYYCNARFTVKPEDYNIKIPATVRNNIAKDIQVTIVVELVPLKKI